MTNNQLNKQQTAVHKPNKKQNTSKQPAIKQNSSNRITQQS